MTESGRDIQKAADEKLIRLAERYEVGMKRKGYGGWSTGGALAATIMLVLLEIFTSLGLAARAGLTVGAAIVAGWIVNAREEKKIIADLHAAAEKLPPEAANHTG